MIITFLQEKSSVSLSYQYHCLTDVYDIASSVRLFLVHSFCFSDVVSYRMRMDFKREYSTCQRTVDTL